MYSWAEEAGVRREEILRIRRSQLPTADQLADVIDLDEPWQIVIVRKGGATWAINPPPDLILRTLNWINHGRAEIVANCRKTIVGYKEPDIVFISSRTGKPLHPDSLTSSVAEILRRLMCIMPACIDFAQSTASI